MSSFEELYRARDNVASRIAIFNQDTQAVSRQWKFLDTIGLEDLLTPFICKPNLALHTDRSGQFLWHTDLRGKIYSVIVTNSRLLSVVVWLGFRYVIGAGIAPGPWELGQKGKCIGWKEGKASLAGMFSVHGICRFHGCVCVCVLCGNSVNAGGSAYSRHTPTSYTHWNMWHHWSSC